jgi:hypothetical protein
MALTSSTSSTASTALVESLLSLFNRVTTSEYKTFKLADLATYLTVTPQDAGKSTIDHLKMYNVSLSCAMNLKTGMCMFIPQNVIHSVIVSETGVPGIFLGARRKYSPDSPNVELYRSFDEAVRSLGRRGLSWAAPQPYYIPVANGTGTPGNVLPRPPGNPPGNILPVTPSPGNSSAPEPPHSWEGEYTTINSTDPRWRYSEFNPIVVKLSDSTSKQLVYTPYDVNVDELLWPVIVDQINSEMPAGFRAFQSFVEAVSYVPSTSNSSNSSNPSSTSNGGGKRTRKNRKNKTGSRRRRSKRRHTRRH